MPTTTTPVTYPVTRRDAAVVDDYFGQMIPDPYRWLEDDQSEETKDWVMRQNQVTNAFLSQLPDRERIKARLQQIWNFEKYGTPFKKAGRYFFFKNDGLQNQSVLYQQDDLDSPPTVLLDPNTFCANGTTALGELEFSRDGRYLAYTTSQGGSDWRTIFILDLQTGQRLPDRIEWVKFTGLAWHGEGFYYSRYPAPRAGAALTASNQLGSIWYHRLGDPSSADQLIYSDDAHPDHYFGATTTEDERFLCLTSSESTSGNTLAFKDLSKNQGHFIPLATTFDHDFIVVDNLDGQLIVLTNYGAPNQQLLSIDSARPDRQHWQVLIPEHQTDVLQSATVCGGRLICVYLHHAASALRAFSLEGEFLQELPLPELGTVGGVSGEKQDRQAFFSFVSFLRPMTIYALDLETLTTRVFKAPQIDFNPDAYLTEQVWYDSLDGTSVPMFITRRKDLVFDGYSPTLLYGYGGFNHPVMPIFSASRAALLEHHGVYAVANIRGGGEFGEAWHKAGTKDRKQNVFDDFIAAAEYLIDRNYTVPARLAIQGGSNGGLLVGACMTQRPELFGVCLPQVGVFDMLRYHRFTIGYAWAADYGRSDNPADFNYLIRYSPLHNLRPEAYPATLITTADHDDRVVPAHSFKFAATLQAQQSGDKPVLIRIETSAGHGAGKPTGKLLEEASDVLAFMLHEMKVPVVY